jgi:hypothetical protein
MVIQPNFGPKWMYGPCVSANAKSHRLGRRALALLVVAPILMLSAPALADVQVDADNPSAGARNVTLTFRAGNELPRASTVAIRIILPTEHPLIGVVARPQHGFAATVRTTRPTSASAGGVASEIDFTGGRISGTAKVAFTVSVRQLPAGATVLAFKALQTYDSGVTVASGGSDPEHPALVLTLAAAGAPESVRQGEPAAVNVAPSTRALPDLLLGGLALAALAAIGVSVVAYQRARRLDLPETGDDVPATRDVATGRR